MIRVEPATRFADVALMVGPRRPDANVCWCLSHRLPAAENRALTGRARGAYVEALCAADPAPGVLAYDEDEVVGWAGVAPRSATAFARSTRIPVIDGLAAWCIWCVRVRPGRRGRGIAHELIAGAVRFAREHDAPVIEAYPADTGGERIDLTMGFVGTRRMFETAGFVKVADTDAVAGGFPRILMRRDPR